MVNLAANERFVASVFLHKKNYKMSFHRLCWAPPSHCSCISCYVDVTIIDSVFPQMRVLLSVHRAIHFVTTVCFSLL